ncbi:MULTISPECIES: queuosine salvage family protein [unclassified Variovorax]|uniref:queuosine salvage family protein n=1 Tax=unclassified Variovorax TaxID=663243 RepID=UPI0013188628|nr:MULTISPECIES: queuosine salvage family protein [unclassified Variovorax]VTU42179.1 hypothetical protein H6P1_00124 [Variovorax sp. PBL-H6]VTU44191.1 hypothetical protein SRS16P1_00778 [Variovorax sp. SRS16]VTU44272.1 hypothetical protein E5P1_00771 [Variovorax sp. PBL-E5]
MHPHPLRNPVLVVAEADYTPHMVRVASEAITALERPSDLGAMGSSLGASPLAAHPHMFVPYFIVMNTMNFQFWDVDAEGQFIRYAHNGKVGALAMQEGFHAAWLEALGGLGGHGSIHEQCTEVASQLRSRIAHEGIGFIFGDIPAAQARARILHEVLEPSKLTTAAEFIARRVLWNGELAWADAQVLAYMFPLAYGDRYLKKAQLTLMFAASEWNARMGGQEVRLDVTAAADYQLPKVLRALELLDYSPAWAAAIDRQELIEAGSQEELAIRAATILAVNELAEHFRCSVEAVDFWLWANRNQARDAKFHLTRTTNY